MSTSVANNGKAVSTQTTFSRTTTIQISIHSSPTIIWNLLTNAQDFTRWNSTILSMEGSIEEGKKIKLKSTTDPSRIFTLKVQQIQQQKSMVWADGMAPFFRGVRQYRLEEQSDGSSTFFMQETLSGLMFPLAAKHIPSFDEPFEQFATDLKKEAEAIQQQS